MRVPRRLSMTERSDFARVRREGKSAGGRFIVMATLQDGSTGQLKLGIITSRKVGKAVVRNKVRRRLRGIFSKHGERIDAPRLLVIIARHKAGDATFQQLEHEWLALAKRLGVIAEQ